MLNSVFGFPKQGKHFKIKYDCHTLRPILNITLVFNLLGSFRAVVICLQFMQFNYIIY